jgi:Tfp pilus assembly protein FimT
MSHARAFTLVELVAAIGLMVLLAAGVPLLFRREGNAGTALRAAQRELATALELARRTAQARQVAVRLRLPGEPEPTETVRRWWLEQAENGQWLALRQSGELPPGTRLVAGADAVPFVEFRPDGSLVGGTRRIGVTLAAAGPGVQAADPTSMRGVSVMADGRIEEDGP